jgi:hypothetical protein
MSLTNYNSTEAFLLLGFQCINIFPPKWLELCSIATSALQSTTLNYPRQAVSKYVFEPIIFGGILDGSVTIRVNAFAISGAEGD